MENWNIIEATIPCKQCGKVRSYTRSQVKTGRVREICQPCSLVAYNASRPAARTKEQKAEYASRYYQEHKEELSGYYADYRVRIKKEMIAAYGGACKECGESDAIVLNLDHTNNDGAEKRREIGLKGGFKFYAKLRNEGWPQEGYQLLCCNCNYRKEFYRRRDALNFFKAGEDHGSSIPRSKIREENGYSTWRRQGV